MIGAEGGIRTLTGLLPTNFKSVRWALTSFYYALPSRIYRRFGRQSNLTSGLVSARNPLIFPSAYLRNRQLNNLAPSIRVGLKVKNDPIPVCYCYVLFGSSKQNDGAPQGINEK